MKGMEHLNLPYFISGLGFFFLGMLQLEQALKNVTGRKMRTFLRDNTEGRVRSIFSGALVTAILQSSSLVSLIVLSFVGTGILALKDAIGIILGANLGTTLSGWLFTFIGFKLNIKVISLFSVGISSFLYFLLENKSKLREISRLILGLSLLFIGLDTMKEALGSLAGQFDISTLSGSHVLTYFAAGFILTAIIQSSSACMVIVLSALHNNILTFDVGAAMILGADLGTTLTVFLGAINGSSEKKRIATASFLYNLIVDLIVLLMLPLFITFITHNLGIKDPLIGLVTFHSTFNLLGIIIFFPFLGKFTDWLETKFIQEEKYLTKCKPTKDLIVIEAGLALLEEESKGLLDKVFNFNDSMFNRPTTYQKFSLGDGFDSKTFSENYHLLKTIEGELYTYGLSLKKDNMNALEQKRLGQLQASQRNFIYSAKGIKDIHQNLVSFYDGDEKELQKLFAEIKNLYKDFLSHSKALYLENQETLNGDFLIELKKKNTILNSELMALYHSLDSKISLEKTYLSSLFNLIAEIHTSNTALLRGVEDLVLDKSHPIEVQEQLQLI